MNRHADHTILPTLFVLLFSVAVLSAVFMNWQPIIILLRQEFPKVLHYGETLAVQGASKPAKVWVNTRSGLYYCADSRYFGKMAPGSFLRQDEALQEGYRPGLKKLC